ncbi:MAG: CehA/McbA family metallohydrolase [Angelakisella sp.]
MNKSILALLAAILLLTSCAPAQYHVEQAVKAFDDGSYGAVSNPELVTDRHEKIAVKPEMEGLDKAYAGRSKRTGDMHLHSLYSDGKTSVEDLVSQMDGAGYDFLALSDHNNWYHQQNPALTAQNSLPAMEWTSKTGHINVFFPDKESLEKVGDFTYKGKKVSLGTGKPMQDTSDFWGKEMQINLRKIERLQPENGTLHKEFMQYIESIGGVASINHPFSGINDSEPLDKLQLPWVFKREPAVVDGMPNLAVWEQLETKYVEIWNGTAKGLASSGSCNNKYAKNLWYGLLQRGHKVYALAGTDGHGDLTGTAAAHLFTTGNTAADTFAALKAGNLSVSAAKGPYIQLACGETPMGGTAQYAPEQNLKVRIGNAPDQLTVRILTDQGTAYYNQVTTTNGMFEIDFPTEPRKYYLVELKDAQDQEFLAFSNPIFFEEATTK